MAQIESIKRVLKEIAASYPGRFQPDIDSVKAWTVYLADIEDDLLVQAVRSFISSSTHGFPPSIPELRMEATKIRRQVMGVPDVWEAWEDLIKAGSGEKREITDQQDAEGRWIINVHKYQFLHPLVESVGRALGWPEDFPMPDTVMADRAAFRDAYTQALSKLTKEDMQLPQVKEYTQAKQLEVQKQIKQLTKGMQS